MRILTVALAATLLSAHAFAAQREFGGEWRAGEKRIDIIQDGSDYRIEVHGTNVDGIYLGAVESGVLKCNVPMCGDIRLSQDGTQLYFCGSAFTNSRPKLPALVLLDSSQPAPSASHSAAEQLLSTSVPSSVKGEKGPLHILEKHVDFWAQGGDARTGAKVLGVGHTLPGRAANRCIYYLETQNAWIRIDDFVFDWKSYSFLKSDVAGECPFLNKVSDKSLGYMVGGQQFEARRRPGGPATRPWQWPSKLPPRPHSPAHSRP